MGEEDLQLVEGSLSIVSPNERHRSAGHPGEWCCCLGKVGEEPAIVTIHTLKTHERFPGGWCRILEDGGDVSCLGSDDSQANLVSQVRDGRLSKGGLDQLHREVLLLQSGQHLGDLLEMVLPMGRTN